MKNFRRFAIGMLTATVMVGAAGCSGMSKQDRNTAIGAGVGAVGGSVLTDGSGLGTVGGAVVGGAVGRQVK